MGPTDTTSGFDVVIYGDAPFDFHLWTNRQHVASRLPQVREGTRVLYVEAPTWVVDRVRGSSLPRRDIELTPVAPHLHAAGERLWVHRTEIPFPTRTAYGALWSWTRRWVVRQVQHSLGQLGFGAPVLWLYGPAGGLLVGGLGERLLCYDVVDDYAITTHVVRQGPRVVAQDDVLTRRADLVFATSRRLATDRARVNGSTTFVDNAADVDLFAQALESQPRPPDLPNGPVALYHGAVGADRIDVELVHAVAARLPELQLVFVGPSTPEIRDLLERDDNVRVLGPRSPEELVPYLAHADVGIVPHLDTPHVRSSNSLKLTEFLAAGLAVVAVDLPCFAGHGPDVRVAQGPDAFAQALSELVADQSERERRRRSASTAGRSWTDKARRLTDLVESALAAQAT